MERLGLRAPPVTDLTSGDLVLTTFAHLIRDVCPAEDSLLARIGGEEFVILLREADPDAARHFADRLRHEVETGGFLVGGERLAITVSIGLAFPSAAETDLTPALERADRALYAAKRGGRNRVEELAAVCPAGLTRPAPPPSPTTRPIGNCSRPASR